MRTLGTLLAERRGAVVGRECELAALRDGPPVMVVHGVAGSGKTALLRAFRSGLTARVVSADGRGIEPTPQGFLAAIGNDEFDVLVVDTAERLRLIDGWLRLEFLPSLPAHARVVIATRDAPGAVWRASFGELLQTIALGPLPPADAAEVLRAAGLDADQAAATRCRSSSPPPPSASGPTRPRTWSCRRSCRSWRRSTSTACVTRRARCSTPRPCCAG